MRTNIIATVVNNVITDRNDRVNVAGVALVGSHSTHSTRIYCTRASELGGGKSALAAGRLPAFPMAMPGSKPTSWVEQPASSRLGCSQRHLTSLASISS